MHLTPLTNHKEIARALDIVSLNWKKRANPSQKNITFSGAHLSPFWQGKKTIWWRPAERIWAYFERNFHETNGTVRHLFLAGLSMNRDRLHVDAQFVVIGDGYKTNLGGVFLQDRQGFQYLGHTGRIGGGKRGVGRTNFLTYCRQDGVRVSHTIGGVCLVDIDWPDRKPTEGFCIVEIASDQLAQRVREFTELRLQFIESTGSQHHGGGRP